MIGVWLLLCVIIPGSVHQYASMRYPVNYMTEFLDVNRKETYATYSLPSETLFSKLQTIYPELYKTKLGAEQNPDDAIIRQTISAIINQMNKTAIQHIEQKNDEKNDLIRSSYWFNPVSFFQNQWNASTSTDYYAYQVYRTEVQSTLVDAG